jgi:hypothetical protein
LHLVLNIKQYSCNDIHINSTIFNAFSRLILYCQYSFTNSVGDSDINISKKKDVFCKYLNKSVFITTLEVFIILINHEAIGVHAECGKVMLVNEVTDIGWS